MSQEQEPEKQGKSIRAELLVQELEKSGILNMDAKLSDLFQAAVSIERDAEIETWGVMISSEKYALIWPN